MAKSHKTKKHQKAEKAKTKLKVRESKTKFLPKGANVTDVNFKVKPIVIREQLKSHSEDEVLSKRKLNIKDLLSRVKHYNTNTKVDALQDLIEIFSSFFEESISSVMESYISQVLQNICRLILDKEKSVRHKTIKLISIILSTVDKNKIQPFSNIILSHLKCAMTDIDKKVQADSLLLMDVLVAHFPQIINDNISKILPVFLVLISSIQSNPNRGKVLSINLQGNLTSIKWRLQVLNRLRKMLNVVVESGRSINECAKNLSSQDNSYDASNNFYLPIYNDQWLDYPFTSAPANFNVDNEEDDNGFPNYVSNFIPLLYDTWLEALPENTVQQGHSEGTVLNIEASSILKSILNIFYLVWQLSDSNEKKSFQEMANLFSNKSGKKFLNRILMQFPYSQSQFASKEKEKEFKDVLQLNTDLKCTEINLLVCYLFCKSNDKLLDEQQLRDCKKVMEYLKNCLTNKNLVKEENIKCLISVVITVMENSTFWISKNINVFEIVDGLIDFYNNTILSEQNRSILLDILCDVAQRSDLNISEKFQKWLHDLPLLFCANKIPLSVARTLSLLSRRKNSIVHKGLLFHLPCILENLPKIEHLDQEVTLMVSSAFFYVPHYDESHKKLLVHFVNSYFDKPIGKTLGNMVNLYEDLHKPVELIK